jgi:hypothetical protein
LPLRARQGGTRREVGHQGPCGPQHTVEQGEGPYRMHLVSEGGRRTLVAIEGKAGWHKERSRTPRALWPTAHSRTGGGSL